MSKIVSRSEAKELGLKRYWTGEPCVRRHIAPRITASGSCHQCMLDDKRAKRSKKPGYRTREEMDSVRDASTRKCAECQGTFPADSEFFVLLKKGDWTGWAAECRACRNARYQPYYENHRKKIIKRATKTHQLRRQLYPEILDQERISSRERARIRFVDPKERAEATARDRQWRKDNPKKVKLFKHNQPHMRRMRAMKRRAQELRAMPPWVDQKEIEVFYALADKMTRETGIQYEVDHYYPLMGKMCCGLHVPANLRVITARENQAKGNKMPEVFYAI